MNCLMIETADKKRFFTHEKHYPQLIEFSKTFDAELSVVNLTTGNPVELPQLATALCDANYQCPTVTYEVIEQKPREERTNRKSILNAADKIQGHILETFLVGEIVSLGDLRTHFKNYNLTSACFCNHMKKAIVSLRNQGINTQKVGAGKYQIEKKLLSTFQNR